MKEVVPYKIGLISTHGTGKSTLVFDLAGELKKRGYVIEVITEVAGELRKQGYPINEETNLASQFSILLYQIIREIQPSAKGYKCDIIISERTVTSDNLVYMERACGNHPFVGKIKEFMESYSRFFPYSRLYLLPLVGDLKEDGIRSVHKEFQRDVSNRLLKFLESNLISYIELPIPKEGDDFRSEWKEIIIKHTLDDLNKLGILKWINRGEQ